MNILAVGAHHDDIELGCGGTFAKYAREGNAVYGIHLTDSETHYNIKNIHRTAQTASAEAKKAAEIIGYKQLTPPENLIAKNGKLIYSAEYMRFLETVLNEQKIDTVFTHWRLDMNTDHEAASKLSIVAARHIPRVLMYRSNWYQPDRAFNGIFYSDISDVMETKIKAMHAYAGEIKNRSIEWMNTFIDSNRSAGFTIGKKYAEIFEPVKYVI